MKANSITDKGSRKRNEDKVFANVAAGVFAIADGMGSEAGGEKASELVVQSVSKLATDRSLPSPQDSDDVCEGFVNYAIEHANASIYNTALKDIRYSGMGSTATLLFINAHRGFVAHVGDCKLYHIRKGKIEKITRDHTRVQELVDKGRLTPSEAKSHPDRNLITRSVGTRDTVVPDTYSFQFQRDDAIVLCSDGLTESLDEENIKQIVLCDRDAPHNACKSLLKRARDLGAGDNISIIVIHGDAFSRPSAEIEKTRRPAEGVHEVVPEEVPQQFKERKYVFDEQQAGAERRKRAAIIIGVVCSVLILAAGVFLWEKGSPPMEGEGEEAKEIVGEDTGGVKTPRSRSADDEKHDSYVKQAEKEWENGNYQAALDSFKSANALKPTDQIKARIDVVESMILKSDAADAVEEIEGLIAKNKYNEAVTKATEALEKYPHTPSAGDLKKLKIKASNLAKEERDFKDAFENGNLMLEKTPPALVKAKDSFEKALRIKKEDVACRRLLNSTKEKMDTYNKSLKDGKESLNKGKADGNIQLSKQAIASFLDAQEVWATAEIRQRIEETAELIKSLEEEAKEAREKPDNLFQSMGTHEDSGNYGEALKCAEEFISEYDGHELYSFVLESAAQYSEELKRYEKVIQYHWKFIEENPSSKKIAEKNARIREMLDIVFARDVKLSDDFLPLLLKFLNRVPKSYRDKVVLWSAQMYLRKGETEKAIAYFSKLLEKYRKVFAEHLDEIQSALDKVFKHPENNWSPRAITNAETLVKQLLTYKKVNKVSLLTKITQFYEDKKDMSKALEYCELLREESPRGVERGEAMLWKGSLLEKANRKEEAIALYDRVCGSGITSDVQKEQAQQRLEVLRPTLPAETD